MQLVEIGSEFYHPNSIFKVSTILASESGFFFKVIFKMDNESITFSDNDLKTLEDIRTALVINIDVCLK